MAPPSLREVGGSAFYGCGSLKRVVLNEGLEALRDGYDDEYLGYYGVFQRSGVEEVVLPSTLLDVGQKAFLGCGGLRTIRARDGCRADLSKLKLPESATLVSQ